MNRTLRVVFTILLLTLVWTFRRTRGAIVVTFLAGIWLRRAWVAGPNSQGALGRSGPPRWVRAASGNALTAGTQRHTGSLFEAPPAKQSTRWW
jgi:hypothetical protein